MKLHRIVAENNQKAMVKIKELLGSEAMIYSTKRVDQGVEVLAALPSHQESHENTVNQFVAPSPQSLDQITNQLGKLQDYVRKIYSCIGYNFTIGGITHDDEPKYKIIQELSKMGFSYQTSNDFIFQYLKSSDTQESELNAKDMLIKMIKTINIEDSDKRAIIALMGPSGAGKTTTIVKLIKRYAQKVGHDKIGIITSDEADISTSNLLGYHAKKLNIELEYARNPQDLHDAVRALQSKQYVFIDTQGLGIKDKEKFEELKALFNFKDKNFYSLIVLPCNYQENVLDEIINTFKMPNTIGCILTKQDETLSMAQAVSSAVKFGMPISYVCDGKDIDLNIYIPKAKHVVDFLHASSFEYVDHENNLISQYGEC